MNGKTPTPKAIIGALRQHSTLPKNYHPDSHDVLVGQIMSYLRIDPSQESYTFLQAAMRNKNSPYYLSKLWEEK